MGSDECIHGLFAYCPFGCAIPASGATVLTEGGMSDDEIVALIDGEIVEAISDKPWMSEATFATGSPGQRVLNLLRREGIAPIALAAIGPGTQGRNDADIDRIVGGIIDAYEFAPNDEDEKREAVARQVRRALASPEKVTAEIATAFSTKCPYCDEMVKSQWTENGCTPSSKYTLIADWVYHAACWDKQLAEYPPEKVTAPVPPLPPTMSWNCQITGNPPWAVNQDFCSCGVCRTYREAKTLPQAEEYLSEHYYRQLEARGLMPKTSPPAASDLRERALKEARDLLADDPDEMDENWLAGIIAAIRAEAKAEGWEDAENELRSCGLLQANDYADWLAANRPSPTGRED
jgi:hypothetical protein